MTHAVFIYSAIKQNNIVYQSSFYFEIFQMFLIKISIKNYNKELVIIIATVIRHTYPKASHVDLMIS